MENGSKIWRSIIDKLDLKKKTNKSNILHNIFLSWFIIFYIITFYS